MQMEEQMESQRMQMEKQMERRFLQMERQIQDLQILQRAVIDTSATGDQLNPTTDDNGH